MVQQQAGRQTIYFSLGTNASADWVVRGATTQHKFIIGCSINNFEPLKTLLFFYSFISSCQ